MAEFVNYNKRNISLPPGCKDLMDVLRGRKGAEAERLLELYKHAKVTRGGEARGSLSDLEDHVRSIFQSHGTQSSLVIRPPDDLISADVEKSLDEGISAFVWYQHGSELEQTVRDFLTQRGLELPNDSKPTSFTPNLPYQIICKLSPLPSGPEEVSRLLLELFRHAGLSDDAPMLFRHNEISEGD